MTGRERVVGVLGGTGFSCQDGPKGAADDGPPVVVRPPILPIIHTGLAGLCGVSLGEFFTDAEVMARVMIDSFRRFGFDGVQLSLGVVAEPEALGAAVEQPDNAGPILREHLLADATRLDALRGVEAENGGRNPLFRDAVAKVVGEIGDQGFVLVTLRGPLNIAAQLRGIEPALIDMIESPAVMDAVLGFGVELTLRMARPLLATGADGVVLGEATASPNFISPDMYRRIVHPHHCRLVKGLKAMGWRFVGLHICGNIEPIIADMIATGVDFADVDYQVPAEKAIRLSRGRIALRGNLDPSSVFRFGTAQTVARQSQALCASIGGARWIVSSGCDIPPGTPAENLAAFTDAVRTYDPL